jgi:hypothetical protein
MKTSYWIETGFQIQIYIWERTKKLEYFHLWDQVFYGACIVFGFEFWKHCCFKYKNTIFPIKWLIGFFGALFTFNVGKLLNFNSTRCSVHWYNWIEFW